MPLLAAPGPQLLARRLINLRSRHSLRLRRMLTQYAQPDASMQGWLRWTEGSRQAQSKAEELDQWQVAGATVGYFLPEFSQRLRAFPDVFQFQERKQGGHTVTLSSSLSTPDERTQAVAGVTRALQKDGVVTGWRNELYPVTTAFTEQPLLLIERAAAVSFGIKSYGVHINGFTTKPEGLHMWIARRSKNKQTSPGKLDHIVAGGQAVGISCKDNVVKECGEEASIPAEIAQTAKAVSAVSFYDMEAQGLKRDVLLCYDLQLDPSFQPQPQDGEVESFQCLPIAEVAHIIAETDEIKANCNVVILDALIRHGHITPDQSGYLQLLTGLRTGDCS